MKTNGFIHRQNPKVISLPMYQIQGLRLMGISYNPVYGVFKDSFLVTPTNTVPSKTRAPQTASGGLSSVLIGEFPFLESFLSVLRGVNEGPLPSKE